jgi:hypothetical protein
MHIEDGEEALSLPRGAGGGISLHHRAPCLLERPLKTATEK